MILIQKTSSLFLNCVISRGCHFVANQKPVRVRFAPSPTGFLHLGGLRTALYNYLFAKSCNGKFLLRIEDTDQTRFVPNAIEQLIEDLDWCGIHIDEGPNINEKVGPYIQSERLDIYKKHVKVLLENRSAYLCFCTEKRLELLRREALKIRQVPKYDNRCRNLESDEIERKLNQGIQPCVRFKLSEESECFNDLIFGPITYNVSANEGDPVIMKTDGFPTYHFANVVDDHLMNISHVLRGIEWQISTTKHLLLYRAFNWQPPLFGHLPLLLNPDGTKLSKRQGDIKVRYYRDTGIFPLALINFITQSGGGFTKDTQRHLKPKCWSFEELSKQFDISRINCHSGKLMPERLLEFNRLELKRQLNDANLKSKLVRDVSEMVKKHFPGDELELSCDHVEHILDWSADRITKLPDLLTDDYSFIWVSPKYCQVGNNEANYLRLLLGEFQKRTHLEKDEINEMLKEFATKHNIQFGNLMKTLRTILSGLKKGPSVAEIIEILGKKNTIHRIQKSLGREK